VGRGSSSFLPAVSVRLRRFVRSVAVVTVASLVVAGVDATLAGPPAAADPAPAATAPPGSVAARPDVASAAAAARAQGSRVKVDDAGSPAPETFANPNGSVTTEAYGRRAFRYYCAFCWFHAMFARANGVSDSWRTMGHAHPHRNSRRYRGRSYVYEMIYHSHNRAGVWHTWKYGVTSVEPFYYRPARQRTTCQRMMHASCSWRLRNTYSNRMAAYDRERALISSYRRRHGGYPPPGQWRSAR
jgi:hypothetical protein